MISFARFLQVRYIFQYKNADKTSLTSQPQITVVTPPPMKPSHVFFGESCQIKKSIVLDNIITFHRSRISLTQLSLLFTIFAVCFKLIKLTLIRGVRPKKNPGNQNNNNINKSEQQEINTYMYPEVFCSDSIPEFPTIIILIF